jgi:hypothetical protein
VPKRSRTRNPNRDHRSPKVEPLRSSPHPASDQTKRIASALHETESKLKKAAKEFRRSALRARQAKHFVEAAIYCRLASSCSSFEKFAQNIEEIRELSAWLPMPAQHRRKTALERKAWQVQFIRRFRLGQTNESSLISSATRRPGRFPETRSVAVRALELHDVGRSWREIESGLLPHRRNAMNPGRSICREVQFLREVLKRYRVLSFDQTA